MALYLKSSTRKQLSKKVYKKYQLQILQFQIAIIVSLHSISYLEIRRFFNK